VFRKLVSGSLVAALMAGTASADTLRDALVSAYQTNPTLTAQQQALEATDAAVAIAKAAGRPQVSATLGLNRDLSRSGILETGGHGPTLSAGLDVSYPLFNGGRVRNDVRAAKTRVEAGRAPFARSRATYLPRPRRLIWTSFATGRSSSSTTTM